MASSKLQTNLVGRKVHLLTDEEARQEASKQEKKLEPEVLEKITAELMYPGIKQHQRYFGDQTGEIVAVRVVMNDSLVYTISFGGELVEIPPQLWRLDPV
jgi:hypothetical protein